MKYPFSGGVGFLRTTTVSPHHGGWPGENGCQQRDGSHLVQRFVAIAAFRRLHARRAAIRALAGQDRVSRRAEPDPGGTKTPFREPCASRVTVIDQDRRTACV